MGCEEIKEVSPSDHPKQPIVLPSAIQPKNPIPIQEPINQPQQLKPSEGLILRRTKGFLDTDDFVDCLMTTEEELQQNIKYYIPSYVPDPKNNGETIRNMDDEILTHTFTPDFQNQVIIAVNGIHVTKIEIRNNKYCIFHDGVPGSKYFYEAFICRKSTTAKEIIYATPKPPFTD